MRCTIFLTLLVPAAAVWLSTVEASKDFPGYCFVACQKTLQSLQFDDMPQHAPQLTQQCQSHKRFLSLYLCLNLYCFPEDRPRGLDQLNQTCQRWANTTIPDFDIIANYTAEDVAHLRRMEKEDYMNPGVLEEAVIPSIRFFKLWFDTLVLALIF